jgi:YVTN family beta-propeller protein
MKFRSALTYLLLWLGCCPVAAPAQGNSGQIAIFLENNDRAEAGASLRLDRIALQRETGVVELPRLVDSLSSADLGRQQRLLVLTEVDPGAYHHLLIRVSLNYPPNAPDSLGLSFRRDLDLPLELEIVQNSTRTVFLKWPQTAPPDSAVSGRAILIPINKTIPPQASLAYITNEGSDNVFIIDRMAGAVVSVIHVGRSPRGLALARSSSLLFVANSESNSLSVIGTDTWQMRQEINLDFGDEPEALCLSADERRLFVANRSSNCVTAFDVGSMSRLGKVSVGNGPVEMALDPTGNWIYVVNSLSDNVSLISVAGLTLVRTLEVGSNPVAIAFDVGRKTAYVANYNSGYLTEINTSSQTVTTTYSLSRSIRGLTGDAFSGTLYCALDLFHAVAVFKASLGVELNEIPVGANPYKVALDTKHGLIYVTCSGANNLSVINQTTGLVVHTIPAGFKPYSVVIP